VFQVQTRPLKNYLRILGKERFFFAFLSFFRNFAIMMAKILRLGIKKIKSFVLLSTFSYLCTQIAKQTKEI